MERLGDTFAPESTKGYQLTIVTQLRRVMTTMHRPDEMFRWLASVIVQRFDISIMQFWTYESSRSGQSSARLQAMAHRDPSLPVQLVVNEKVALTVEHISRGQPTSPPRGVEQMFPSYQASLLKRYGIGYCAYCWLDRNVCFAPVEYALAHERTSTGLTFIALLFLRSYPRRDIIPALSVILEQAVVVAENHRLLLPVAVNTDRLPSPQARQSTGPISAFSQVATGTSRSLPQEERLPQDPLSALANRIPRLTQDAHLLVSSSPFARSATISDKQALRLYAAIDGRKTVEELCSSTDMTLREVQAALQTLLNLRRIEI